VPLDSIVGVETFEGRRLAHRASLSTAATAATGAVAALAAAVLLVAIFGSCPTIYADTGASAVLQAEGFSYAIAPLLEQRDLDPLRVRPDSNGVIRLELRNEALETHYINNLELISVRHARDARAIPDQDGRPLVVSGIRPFVTARDRAGRDVGSVLAAADGNLFLSAQKTVDAARVGDLDDWIDIDASDLGPGDSVAVVLRLRNSLLNTVLLYDGILNSRDAPEWLDTGLEHISTAIDLSKWYMRTMGMRASVSGVRAPSSDRRGTPDSATSVRWRFATLLSCCRARVATLKPRAFACVSLPTIGESTTSPSPTMSAGRRRWSFGSVAWFYPLRRVRHRCLTPPRCPPFANPTGDISRRHPVSE
jgi:hypothetical protein